SDSKPQQQDPVATHPLDPARAAEATDPIAQAPSKPGFEPTIPNPTPPPGDAPDGMVWIPGGEFSMGSEDPRESLCGGPDAMPDARPIHRVYVDGFWMDKTEVTNENSRSLPTLPVTSRSPSAFRGPKISRVRPQRI